MLSTPKRRAAAWFVIGVLAAALVILAAFTILRSSLVLDKVRSTQIDSRETALAIKDCTTPGRPCFERGQKQTAAAVASINRVAILAAACADKPQRQSVEQIQSCVIEELAKQGATP